MKCHELGTHKVQYVLPKINYILDIMTNMVRFKQLNIPLPV